MIKLKNIQTVIEAIARIDTNNLRRDVAVLSKRFGISSSFWLHVADELDDLTHDQDERDGHIRSFYLCLLGHMINVRAKKHRDRQCLMFPLTFGDGGAINHYWCPCNNLPPEIGIPAGVQFAMVYVDGLNGGQTLGVGIHRGRMLVIEFPHHYLAPMVDAIKGSIA